MANIAKRENCQLTLQSLDEDKRQKILNIKESLELSYKGISEYGVSISKNLSNFSTEILSSMKAKDNPEIGTLIGDLLGSLSEVDADTLLKSKSSFFN